MKHIIYPIFILFASLSIAAQPSVELKVGGSNLKGATISASYRLEILPSHKIALEPSFGVGILSSAFGTPNSIIQAGLDYRFYQIGLGLEASAFLDNPFLQGRQDGFIDLVIYPNVYYSFHLNRKLYLQISGGLSCGFSKEVETIWEAPSYSFEGDIIPGIGLTIGYQLIK